MTDEMVVFSTCSSADEGERIARSLVDAGVAACVNIVPGIRSIYRWQGTIEDAGELLLIVKTRKDLLEALITELRRVHSYNVPEIIALPVLGGSREYLEWIRRETRSSTEQ